MPKKKAPSKHDLLPLLATSFVALVSILYLIGWINRSPLVLELFPESAPISITSADCFLLLCLAIYCLPEHKRIGISAATACMVLAGLSALPFFYQYDLSDALPFVPPWTAVQSIQAKKIFPHDGLGFLLSGFALLLFNRGPSLRNAALGSFAVLGTAVISTVTLLGYALHLQSKYASLSITAMALPAAACHVLISITLLREADRRFRVLGRYRRFSNAIAALIGGIAISLSLWLAALAAEQRALQGKIERTVELSTTTIQNEIDRDIETLRSTQHFFSNSDYVSIDEFHGFLDWQFSSVSSIDSIAWVPQVRLDEKFSWEAEFQRPIISADPAALSTATVYFPEQYVVPSAGTKEPLAFDYVSDVLVRDAMDAALRTHAAQSSIVQSSPAPGKDAYGDGRFRVVLPVVHASAEQYPARRDDPNLLGYIVGNFRMSQLVAVAINRMPEMAMDVTLSPATQSQIKVSFSECAPKDAGNCEQSSSIEKHATLQVASNVWKILYQPTRQFVAQQQSIYPNTILISALFLTLTTTIYIFIDSKRKEELRWSDERYRLLVDGVNDYAIFALDIEGRVTTWNSGAERMKGYCAAEIIGKHFSIFYPPDEISAGIPEKALITARSVGQYQIEGRCLRRDGTEMWAHILITPIHAADGVLRGYTKITRDISERRRIEDLLRQQNAALHEARRRAENSKEQAEAATVAKSQFVANVSHEIRTPLTSIIGFTEELLKKPLATETQEEQLGVVLRNARHLLHLLNDILDLSKVEAGKLDIEMQDVSLLDIAAEIQLVMAGRAKQKNLKFSLQQSYPVPKLIRTDPTRLRQIAFNLIDNAIKFTQSGSIDVSLDCSAPYERVTLRITDSGIGMTAEQVQKLFSTFSQADASISRRYGGTGLGLYISQELAQRLGGDIAVTSTPNHGSTFVMTIRSGCKEQPELFMQPPEVARSMINSTDSVRYYEGTVLLAEDVPDTQKLLSIILRDHGLEVTLASNGEEALSLARGQKFDLIFMDMQMPVIDGLAATRALRETGHYEPVIALTANVLQGRVEQCIMAGCNGCLAKPFERNALLGVLSLYLSESSAPKNSAVTESFDQAIQEFKNHFSLHLTRLRHAIMHHDFIFIAKTAHALAGAAAFGYPAIRIKLRALEEAAEENDSDRCAEELEALEAIHSNRPDSGTAVR